jgi:hypothetical protein
MPEKRAGNPRDVADLFVSLDVEHLRYREFQLPEEAFAAEFRLTRATPRRRIVSIENNPVNPPRQRMR